MRAAKDIMFNKNMEALKKMQAGADKLATVVGVTLGPKVCRCCLQCSHFLAAWSLTMAAAVCILATLRKRRHTTRR